SDSESIVNEKPVTIKIRLEEVRNSESAAKRKRVIPNINREVNDDSKLSGILLTIILIKMEIL
ncbi:hypothetical protein BpHYR1_013102, partial [Brachionus plicatilis]